MLRDLPIAILLNSFSGKGKAIHICRSLEQILTTENISFSTFSDDWPLNLSGFSEAWVIGGDGTVNYYINRYPEHDIPFAIFKGGTGNDLSQKLYGDLSPEEQAHLVLKASGKRIDAGNCNGRLYANSLGIGFDGEVLRSMNAVRWLGGHLGYLAVVIKNIFSFREIRFCITAGDKIFKREFLLVIVNNSTTTGGGFLVSPAASLTDGKLDMVLCDKLPVLKRLRYLPVIEKGKHLSLPFISYSRETTVNIACEKEIFAQVDGELISATVFNISVSKDALFIKY